MTLKKPVLLAIRFYQKVLSFDTGLLKWLIPSTGTCRFSPRCSEYAYLAVSRYGTMKGLYLGFRRILRCNGFFAGGVDPLP